MILLVYKQEIKQQYDNKEEQFNSEINNLKTRLTEKGLSNIQNK